MEAKLIDLTNEMRELVNNARESGNPCIVATTSTSGTPNCGYIGTVLALDESSFVYRDRSGQVPLEHIEENPKLVLLFRHSGQATGWKFRCTASVHRDGPVYEDAIKRLFESGLITDPESKTAAVVLRVDQVLTLFGELLQEREPGLSW
jgi:predicted pyridoxine 5'-phosphate oxidase superfamily flavin-nucleotide-binding protein